MGTFTYLGPTQQQQQQQQQGLQRKNYEESSLDTASLPVQAPDAIGNVINKLLNKQLISHCHSLQDVAPYQAPPAMDGELLSWGTRRNAQQDPGRHESTKGRMEDLAHGGKTKPTKFPTLLLDTEFQGFASRHDCSDSIQSHRETSEHQESTMEDQGQINLLEVDRLWECGRAPHHDAMEEWNGLRRKPDGDVRTEAFTELWARLLNNIWTNSKGTTHQCKQWRLPEHKERDTHGNNGNLTAAAKEGRMLNGPILVWVSTIITNVIASAAKGEEAKLFINAQEADSMTAHGIINGTMEQKLSKAIDTVLYWLQDRAEQGQFEIFLEPDKHNLVD
eukprot:jgi/Psemu1/10252/gm1.10252_g